MDGNDEELVAVSASLPTTNIHHQIRQRYFAGFFSAILLACVLTYFVTMMYFSTRETVLIHALNRCHDRLGSSKSLFSATRASSPDYAREMQLFQSLNEEERRQYLNMTRQAKFARYASRLASA